MDEVIIAPPYASSDVKGNKAERVDRVRKIVSYDNSLDSELRALTGIDGRQVEGEKLRREK